MPTSPISGKAQDASAAPRRPAAASNLASLTDHRFGSTRRVPWIGTAPALIEAERRIRRFAPLAAPVLIQGETGTGKEVAAQAIHDLSPRHDQPFVAVNCAAIVDGLAESELFGHRRGAFTGAHRDHTGAFARAEGGTLFLDEVAELPLVVQGKLLRALETGRIQPVGASGEQPVRVRVVAATHRLVERMIRQGQLREDLYHRLSVLRIHLPPLRERQSDIPALLQHFLDIARRELGSLAQLSPEAIRAATRHPWPGNVRALKNAVLRASALADTWIEPEDLLGGLEARDDTALRPRTSITLSRGRYEDMKREMLRSVVVAEGSLRRAALALDIPRSTLSVWLRADAPPSCSASSPHRPTASLPRP